MQASGRSVEIVELNAKTGALRVKATAPDHERLGELIEAARTEAKKCLTIECRLLTFPSANMSQFHEELSRKISLVLRPNAIPVALSPFEVSLMLRAAQGSKAGMVLTAPRVTLYNYQQAYVLVTTQTHFVSGHKKVKEREKEVWKPQSEVVDAGISLACHASISADARTIALNVDFQTAAVLETKEVPFEGAPGEGLTIQVPMVDKVQVRRLLALNDGESVIMPVTPAGLKKPSGGVAEKDDVQFIIVKAEILK
jgi:hypothetical protein